MKYLILFAAIFLPIYSPAQTPPAKVSTPQHIVVDSKDNVFVTLKYGLLKIAPDGTVTDLSKQGPVIGGMDRTATTSFATRFDYWKNECASMDSSAHTARHWFDSMAYGN